MTGGASDAERVRALREALTATGAGIYLATHVAGPLPAETMAAVHESDDLELRIGRVGPDREDDLEQREWEARAAIAAVIKAPFERVVLAHGAADATRSLCLEILADRVGPSGVLASGSLGESSRAAPNGHGSDTGPDTDGTTTDRSGAHPDRPAAGPDRSGVLRDAVIPNADDRPRAILLEGLADPVADAIRGVMRAVGGRVDQLPTLPEILGRDVALVAVPHVDPVGRLRDPRPLAAVAHRAGARLIVDVSLGVGALPFEVSDLGSDAVVGDVHHWLLGPEGLAFAWLGPSFRDESPARIAASTGPFGRGPLLALARSVGWLLMYVDLPWVVSRTGRLARRVFGSLASVDGIELLSERSSHGPLLAFRIAGWDPEQAADELSRSAFVIADVEPDREAVRVSVGAWNREDELDRFVERVAEMASHTPATLPRRPSLTVISGPMDGR